MSVTRERVATHNGKEVYLYTLDNEKGLTAQILNFGGIIKSLKFNGIDTVLGRNSFDEYLNNDGYMGALIGRNSNRIVNACFELNGKAYTLTKNDGENNLHGGEVGFDKKVWDSLALDNMEPALILSLTSQNNDEGFPGEVKVKVTYTLTAENSLKIHYEGETDEDTILNMTNHSYFNLNGHNSGLVANHKLWLNSSFYTPNSKTNAPTGEILSVKNTPFDFREEHPLKEALNSNHSQIILAGGLDHNFAVDGFGYRLAARFIGEKTGITMETYTDSKGIQLYSANFTGSNRICKDGAIYGNREALCFETQAFPNFTAYSHFPTAILKKGEKYDTTTTYKFSKN